MAGREEAQALADKLMGKTVGSEADAVKSLIAGVRQVAREEADDDDDILDDDDDNLDEGSLDEGDDDGLDDEEEGSPDGGDDDEEDRSELDDEPPAESDEYDYDENDLIEVTVDGETREVTLRELVQNFSGEGAIQKRLKDATTKLQAADERAVAVENEVQQKYSALLQTVQSLDDVIFAPLVNKPNPKLRATNMQQYLLEQDAYEEDQRRISESRATMAQAMQVKQQQLAQARHAFRVSEHQKLLEKLPDLMDEVKGKQINDDLIAAAAHYGFTPEQVADVDLHGILLMALDAGKWLKLENARKGGKTVAPKGGDAQVKTGRRLKKLKPGGVASIKASAQKKAKVRSQVASKARESGNVNDVADFLLASATTRESRGKRNGR